MAPWEKEKAFHVIYPSMNLKRSSFVTWVWIIGCHFGWAFYKHNNIQINKTAVSLFGLSLLSLPPSVPAFPTALALRFPRVFWAHRAVKHPTDVVKGLEVAYLMKHYLWFPKLT